jgi:signal transduction histidine kinase
VNEAELLEDAPLSTDESHRFAVLERTGLLERDDSEPFHRVARLARRLLGVDTAIVSLIDRDRHIFHGHDGLRPALAGRGESVARDSYCKHVVATGERLVIGDARATLLLRNSPGAAHHDALAYAGVPLEVSQGAVLGTLCVFDSSPRSWTTHDLDTLEELAAVALAEIERRIGTGEVDGVSVLAGRLEDPVAKLGDVVRTVAGLVECTSSEAQLPRLADVARSRVTTVEALTNDLVRAATTRGQRLAPAATVDVRRALEHARDPAWSGLQSDDLLLDLPDEPVTIEWPARPTHRALGLLVTTALNHLAPGGQVTVRLTTTEDEALVNVHVAGAPVRAGELLRVVGHFRDRHDEELPLDVTWRAAGTTARNSLITATSTAADTDFQVRWPR